MSTQIWAGIIGAAGAFLGILAAAGVIFYVTRRKLYQLVRSIVQAPDPSTPSPLATFTDLVAGIFAAQITASLKGTFMGMESAAAKQARKVAAGVAVAQSPILAALLQSFPSLGKLVKNNPALAGLAAQAVEKVATGSGSGGNGQSGTSVKFNF